MRRNNKRKIFFSIFLAFLMSFGNISIHQAKETNAMQKNTKQITEKTQDKKTIQKILDGNKITGLVGFKDISILDSDEKVFVIVEFHNKPAKVQEIINETLEISPVSLLSLENSVEQDHMNFDDGLEQLFSNTKKLHDEEEFKILNRYKATYNGVSMMLPGNRISDLLTIQSVKAVYYDEVFTLDPVEVIPIDNATPVLDLAQSDDPVGMRESRKMMQVNELHEQNIKGKNVVVGVIDSGVDPNHPDLANIFMSKEEALRWNPNLEDDDFKKDEKLNQEFFYGRNLVSEDYYLRAFNFSTQREKNNPFEASEKDRENSVDSKGNKTIPPSYNGNFYTSHGTHVIGTIAARNENPDTEAPGALGVAPESKVVVYRVFGPYGLAGGSNIMAAIEDMILDGCDVANLSLGFPINDVYHPSSMAISHAGLAYKNTVCVISAGNSGPNSETVSAPANSSGGICVGSIETPIENASCTLKTGPDDKAIWGDFIIHSKTSKLEQTEEGIFITGYEDTMLNGSLPNSYRAVLCPSYESDHGPGIGLIQEIEQLTDEEIGGNFLVVRVYDDDVFRIYNNAGKLTNRKVGGFIIIDNPKAIPAFSYGQLNGGVPTLYMSHEEGNAFLEQLKNNDNSFTFESIETKKSSIQESTSVGPNNIIGSVKPDVSAPGVSILSTIPIDLTRSKDYKDAYRRYTGTSMAAPHITGLVALLKGQNSPLPKHMINTEIKCRIVNNAQFDEPANFGIMRTGGGTANAKKIMDNRDVFVSVFGGDPAIVSDRAELKQIDMDTGTFSFGYFPIETELTKKLTATIHNDSIEEKNYRLRIKMSDIQYKYDYFCDDHTGIEFDMPQTVSVQPYGKSTFDFSVIASDITSEEQLAHNQMQESADPRNNPFPGSHEGFLILDEIDQHGNLIKEEQLVLPFAAIFVPNKPIVANAYLAHPVINSDYSDDTAAMLKNMPAYWWWGAKAGFSQHTKLCFDLTQKIVMMQLFIYDKDEKLIGQWLLDDEWMDDIPPEKIEIGGLFGVYYEYEENNSLIGKFFEEGYYKVRLGYKLTYSSDYQYSDFMDFYIDNHAPTLLNLEIDDVKRIVKGQIFDFGIEEMKQLKIKSKMAKKFDEKESIDYESVKAVLEYGNDDNFERTSTKAQEDGSFIFQLTPEQYEKFKSHEFNLNITDFFGIGHIGPPTSGGEDVTTDDPNDITNMPIQVNKNFPEYCWYAVNGLLYESSISHPTVIETLPKTPVSVLTKTMSVVFNQEMDKTNFGIVKFENQDLNKDQITWSEDGKIMTISLPSALRYGSSYRLEVRDFVNPNQEKMLPRILTFVTEQEQSSNDDDDDTNQGTGGGSGGGGSTVKKEISIYVDGKEIKVNDTAFDQGKYVSKIDKMMEIKLSALQSISTKNKSATIEVESQNGAVSLPVGLSSIVNNLEDIIQPFVNEELALRVTILDRWSDFNNSITSLLSAVEYKFEIVDQKTEKVLYQISEFNKPLARRMIVNQELQNDHWAAYRMQNNQKKFVAQQQNSAQMVTLQSKYNDVFYMQNNDPTFSDVDTGNWAYPFIKLAATKHLIQGTGQNQYEPNRSVTRAEFVQMIINSLELDKNNEQLPYGDVLKNQWFYEAIQIAYDNGLLKDFNQESFAPNQTINREEMAGILLETMKILGVSFSDGTDIKISYDDDHEIDPVFKEAVLQLSQLKMMEGMGNNMLRPKDPFTRSQAAKILISMLKHTKQL